MNAGIYRERECVCVREREIERGGGGDGHYSMLSSPVIYYTLTTKAKTLRWQQIDWSELKQIVTFLYRLFRYVYTYSAYQ